jgi:O-antigen/teichoic acid export membrane protein
MASSTLPAHKHKGTIRCLAIEAAMKSQASEKQQAFDWLMRQQGQTRNWLRRGLGIDRAIGFTVLARGWSSLAGIVTVALIARFLSRAEQGYYYTFGSLIALQIVFELGFSFVILQMASHERAFLTFSPEGVISGESVAHSRLASVLQKTIHWYTAAAIFLAVFLLTVGSHFFSTYQHGGLEVSWRFPWYAAALASTLTFQLDPVLSFMEGCGFVTNIARLRFTQAFTGSTLAWLSLATHHGLFAPAMMILGNACAASVWLLRHRRLLLSLLQRNPGEHRVHWMNEVWPFQWRIAVSWLTGYFIYQLYTPVLFAYRGPIEAGQMGMSLSLANALQSVAISWINTKAAPFGALIARKDYLALDSLFFRALRQSAGVFVASALLVWTGAMYLNWTHARFAQRLLTPGSLAILLLSTFLNVVVFGLALYLRAHKQEKFLIPSIAGAILVTCSTYFLGKHFGAFGMVSGNLTIALLMGLPSATFIFFKYRKAWHED